MDMKTTRTPGDLSRAERKARKRKLESTILGLPSNDDDFHPEIQNHSLSGLDGHMKSKKRKRDGEAAANTFRSKKVGIAAKTVKRNALEKPLKQYGIAGGKPDHFNSALALSEHIELVKGMSIDKTTRGGGERLIDTFDLSEECHHPKEPHKKHKAQDMVVKDAQTIASNSVTHVLGQEMSEAGEERNGKLEEDVLIKGVKQKDCAIHKLAEKVKPKEPRFIVFIGNLPFTATEESIRKHFTAVHPKSIRHLTKKHEPTQSRGCAFVEFEGYDHMKSCLKSFHHSLFDDGISAPRRINVELTAGGGGNKTNRQGKINKKNQKLNEERVRRMQEEDKDKLAKKHIANDHNDMHPSRRARVLETF